MLAPSLMMKKRVETLQKQTMGIIFKIQNPSLLTWSLPTEVIFQNRPVANLPFDDFRSQPREMPLPKNTECVTCRFPFLILVFVPF